MALNYGIIGNSKTSALVKEDASIEWCCFPRFDSPSVFAKILDKENGGSFEIKPEGAYKIKQEYIGNTNILKTTYYSRLNKFEIIDFFPLYLKSNGRLKQSDAIHRLVKVIKGKPRVKITYNPKLDYARAKTRVSCCKDNIVAKGTNESLYLYTNADCRNVNKGAIALDKDMFFLISYNRKEHRHTIGHIKTELKKTADYWRKYLAKRTLPNYAKKQVIRSILVLKLLTYYKSGAIVAAATTSLPEIIGKERNWDYRYCWLRDAAFTMNAFTKVGSFEETKSFIKFLMKLCKMSLTGDFSMQIMYGVEGEKNLRERVLSHLKGYKNSRPVRIGNAAYKQLQIDILGEIIDIMYGFFIRYNYVEKMSDEQFNFLRVLVERVIKVWRKKDSGVWEFRNIREHFVYSKLMSWVALDRAIILAEIFKKDCPIKEWMKVRDEIREEILTRGWSKKKKTFTMSYDSDKIDASVLLMYHYRFISPKDERFVSTVKAVEKELVRDGLILRYDRKDDFGFQKNPFTTVTFWFIDALYATGKKRKAIAIFRKVLKYTNHLGLFSEDIDVRTKELLGNFPQAYTHIALINTAVLLGRKGRRRMPVSAPELSI